uniref:uncharacterized protein LOC100179045 isoform X2 n=1 Tax=Ciona intestinalis TaxID=7719 RepID=UPI000EF4651E|nr:uncharacterized protein LOC100179045 isoform X2 [Ciona intestinalis]|eukprot:XP_026689506.1 uncharacterized protein LOC100179045 isoform X2 [Ciona intestinalis]
MIALRVLVSLYIVAKAVHGTSTTPAPVEYRKASRTCCAISDSSSSPGCAMTNLVAGLNLQIAFSPSYPNRFPIDRMCSWSIRCRKEHRIRIEFRDFYLIMPAERGCVDQSVLIWSPLTNRQMGPFCGNSGLPTIVSAGNLLVVKLKSEIPVSGEDYRGFTMAFKETSEDPTIELQIPNWHSNDAIRLDEPALVAAVNRLQPYPSGVTVLPSARPGRTGNLRNRTRNNPLRPRPPSRRPTRYNWPQNKRKSKKSTLPLKLEVLIGIGIGGVVGIAFIIFLICCINRKCKDNKNKQPDVVASANNIELSEREGERASGYVADRGSSSAPLASQHTGHRVTQPSPDTHTKHAQRENKAYVPDNPYSSYPPAYPYPSPNPPIYNSMPPMVDPSLAYQQGYPNNYGQVGMYGTLNQPVHTPPPVMLYDTASGAIFNSSQLQVVPANMQPIPDTTNQQPETGRSCAIPSTRDRSRPRKMRRTRKSATLNQERTRRSTKQKPTEPSATARTRQKRRRQKKRR